MKILVVNGNVQYWHLMLGYGFQITPNEDEADVALFTGGADVTPKLYGDKQHNFTGNDEYRDAKETALFHRLYERKIPMVGICRGGQFLNVMSGGRMYQHVSKHTQSHTITDLITGETIYVSSTHHQMMMPSPDGLLVASSTLGGHREWFDGEVARKDVSKEDIEVVFYEKTKCLCFQPHPEFGSPEYEGMRLYFRSLLNRYLEI